MGEVLRRTNLINAKLFKQELQIKLNCLNYKNYIILKMLPPKSSAYFNLRSFTDVWQVNLRALQCLPKILPCLANQSGALMPPVVAALTSNFASKNANIFSTAEEALDELIKYIGISFTVVISHILEIKVVCSWDNECIMLRLLKLSPRTSCL